jgi:nucleoside 2-deoxyribosyltransferase
MKIFIICSVRQATVEYSKKLYSYAHKLEQAGHQVHLPPRDTDQSTLGIDICRQNRQAIKEADEVHVFYSSQSQGTHFDLGMAFGLEKRIKVLQNETYGIGKSFPRMLVEWEGK